MATTQASTETCGSPAGGADQTRIRTSTKAHDASLASGQVRQLRPVDLPLFQSTPVRSEPPGLARCALGGEGERRRLERDLHDGVQTELVALLFELTVAQQDPETPPALARRLAAIEGRAQAALDAVRNIGRGIYPPVLADFGLREALRAQVARVAVGVRLVGTAPRGSEEAEEAAYFACSEAIQNVVKHAGVGARVGVGLLYHRGSLVVRIADDGRGFDCDQTTEGVGLRNIRERVEDLGGTFGLASRPGFGTVLTLALPWPGGVDRD